MKRYDPLYLRLQNSGEPVVNLGFAEIEKLTGHPLPKSALLYDWFWANEDPETTRHVHCRAWTAAGYAATVDLKNETVRFRFSNK